MASEPPLAAPLLTLDYASQQPARKKLPMILWWFFGDFAIFLGAIVYMMVAFEAVGPYKDLPPRQEAILNLWMLAAFALFMFLLGWVSCGWWRARRAG